MNLKSLIISTLAPTNVPVSFQKYSGSATTYITFFEYNQGGAMYGDDIELTTRHYIQVDVWSQGNYSTLVEQVRTLLINAGFDRTGEGELHEDATKTFHKYFSLQYTV